MRKKLLMKSLLVAAGLCVGTSAWADTTTVGAETLDSGFDAEKSTKYSIGENQKLYLEFTNYTNTTMDSWQNWFNWVLVFQNATEDYTFLDLRADNYGWADCYDATNLYTRDYPWETFRTSMNEANVKMTISRENGRISIYALMTKDASSWSESYFFDLPSSITSSDAIKAYLTVENSKIVIDNDKTTTTDITTGALYSVGTSDNNALFFSTFSDYYTIAPNQTLTFNFKNYSLGGGNYQNWIAVITNNIKRSVTGYTEYLVLRNDNWAWGTKYEAGTLTSNFNWDTFIAEMNGSNVVMTVTNNNGSFIVNADITASDGTTKRFERFEGTCDDNETLNFFLSSDHSHLDITSVELTTNATLGTNGYATFASSYALDLAKLPTGLKAYKAKVNGTSINFTQVTEAVPANTGLLLEGTASTTYAIPVAASASALADNDFEVNTTGTTFTAGEYTYYGMNKDSDPLTFGNFDPSTVAIPANKAYVKVASVSPARQLTATFGETSTITAVATQLNNNEYFNLAGQRVAQPTKGLYIVNGKKVVIK